jgi:hypothetical protein
VRWDLPTDDEGHQIGGHDHAGGEADPPFAVGLRRLLDDGAVRVGGQVVVDDEGHLEGGLQLRFVPARKGPAGVGRLHLGGGDDVVDPGLVGEGGAVEAVELVVEDAREAEVQGGRSDSERLGEGEGGLLLRRIEADGGGHQGVAVVGIGGVEFGEGDVEFGSVQRDRRGRRVHRDIDLHIADEGGPGEVGGQDQPVGVGPDGGREPVGGGVVGGGCARDGVGCRCTHDGQATVGPCLPTPQPANPSTQPTVTPIPPRWR